MVFEKANVDSKSTMIFDWLGKPFFEDDKKLNDKKFEKDFSSLQKGLKIHGINVEFTPQRNGRFKYHFITKELFDHETHLFRQKK